MAGGAGPIIGRVPVKRTFQNYPDAILRHQAERDLLSTAPHGTTRINPQAVYDKARSLAGPPTSAMGTELVSIDDGFLDILKDMSPDLMAKHKEEEIYGDPYAKPGRRVGSSGVSWANAGDWDTQAPSMAPWLRRKRRV